MELFYFTPITRKRVRIGVSGTLSDGAGAVLDDVDVAMLPLRSVPDATTVWTDATLTDGDINPLVAAPDASQTGALPLTATGGKLWLKVVDEDEVDAVVVAEFRVLQET
jgi:hypothetical protein